MVCICDKERWSRHREALRLTRSRDEVWGGYIADQGLVLTRSGCFGLHTRLGSDFLPTDNDSDNDCW